ncbi:MAG: hypothetical protein KDI92_04135 [Xanthomonadales bacterium]|nr:hypothetical protein [Xanthomonadales bacterium]
MRQTKIFFFSLLFLILVACQQPIKPDKKTETLAWTELQQHTLFSLQEKNYGDAIRRINEMMSLAGQSQERWEYIRMALVTVPVDLSLPLVDKALKNSYIKNNPDELYGFSRVLTQFQKNQPAVEVISKAISKEKKAAYVYWRARLYLMLEDTEHAEQDYLWLLQQEPKNSEYLGQYATLLSYTQRNDEALALLSSADLNPKLLFQQIVLLFQQQKNDEVMNKFEQLKAIIETEELTAKQYLEIGELAYWLEDYDTSLSVLQKIKNSADLSAAKLLMGRALMEQGNDDRAIILFKQVQNGPAEQAIPAYLNEIELLRKTKKLDTAITIATQALQMFPNNADLLYSRAMLHEQNNHIDKLEKDLKTILKDDPENADALNALGYTWADHDMNLDMAYEHIMQAYALKPDNKAILDSVGWIYYKKGDLTQAEKYLRMAIDGNELDRESYDHLVIVLNAQGKRQEADQIKDQIRERFPSENNRFED